MAKWITQTLHRRSFAQIGNSTVIMRPLRLQGVDQISIGEECSLVDGTWLAVEAGGGPLASGINLAWNAGRSALGRSTHPVAAFRNELHLVGIPRRQGPGVP